MIWSKEEAIEGLKDFAATSILKPGDYERMPEIVWDEIKEGMARFAFGIDLEKIKAGKPWRT